MKIRSCLIVLVLLVVVAAGVLFSVMWYQAGKTQEEFGVLADACRGRVVAGTAPYVPGSGVHLGMAVSQISGDSRLRADRYLVPDEALASELAQVELVACVGAPEEVLLERCPYSDDAGGDEIVGIVERYRQVRQVRVVAASTGQEIASEQLQGDEPRACLDRESFLEGQDTIKVVGEVSDFDVAEWLRQYLLVP